ncbi:hypothetical protein [Thalassoroseus pseudoceratinae]|uniref:hypothetical protein n=1 Tax=Thalassoroseus pseudoceratinae TaxID=2713176 RepID=UPI00141FCF8E|nr:hypothetical protein [Thalassoroseus pseudoceratinae]
MKMAWKAAIPTLSLLVVGTSPLYSQDRTERTNNQSRAIDNTDRGDRQGRTDRRTRSNTRSETSSSDRRSSSERQEALQHFLAGYYAGYSEGYYDGYDDSALVIVETIEKRSQDRKERDSQVKRPEQMQQQRERMRHQLRNQHQFPDHDGLQEVSGEVTDHKTVPIHGTDTEHLVVRLKTDFGGRKIVDLGPKQNLEAWDIKEGQRLSVQGQSLQAQDMRVIAARRVHADGKTVDIKYIRPKFVKDAVEDADEDLGESPKRNRRRNR